MGRVGCSGRVGSGHLKVTHVQLWTFGTVNDVFHPVGKHSLWLRACIRRAHQRGPRQNQKYTLNVNYPQDRLCQ